MPRWRAARVRLPASVRIFTQRDLPTYLGVGAKLAQFAETENNQTSERNAQQENRNEDRPGSRHDSRFSLTRAHDGEVCGLNIADRPRDGPNRGARGTNARRCL
jgi:hypothetical protein